MTATPEQVQDALHAALYIRAGEGLARSLEAVEAVTVPARRAWRQIRDELEQAEGRGYSANVASFQTILDGVAVATERAIEEELLHGAEWAEESAWDAWGEALPATWWAVGSGEPMDVEESLVSFDYGKTDDEDEGWSAGRLTGRRAAVVSLKYKRKKGDDDEPPPGKKRPDLVDRRTVEKTKQKKKLGRDELLKIIRSKGWKARMQKWSKKITDKDAIAEKIAAGIAAKKSVDQVAKSIEGLVSGFAASARRVARTEMARVENQLLERTFKEFDEIIAGFQIINPLDERTRPAHALRAGRIYWKDKSKPYNVGNRPDLPDEPNCRCKWAPVLRGPSPEALASGPRVDPRTYGGWFNKQTDEVKAGAVGKARWAAMTSKLKPRRPSWYDFVDERTGQMRPLESLRKESVQSVLARRERLASGATKARGVARRAAKRAEPKDVVKETISGKTKGQWIEEFILRYSDKKNSEIVAFLKNVGVETTPGVVSDVKVQMRKKGLIPQIKGAHKRGVTGTHVEGVPRQRIR